MLTFHVLTTTLFFVFRFYPKVPKGQGPMSFPVAPYDSSAASGNAKEPPKVLVAPTLGPPFVPQAEPRLTRPLTLASQGGRSCLGYDRVSLYTDVPCNALLFPGEPIRGEVRFTADSECSEYFSFQIFFSWRLFFSFGFLSLFTHNSPLSSSRGSYCHSN